MNNRKKKVSLQTIADRLGISKYAVSLALNNKPGVSDALRSQVLLTAQELGYTKPGRFTPSAKKNLLVLIPEYIRNDTFFFSDIYWAIESEIQQEGHTAILTCVSRPMEEALVLPDIFSQTEVSGFVAVGVFSLPYIRRLCAAGIPFVSVDQYYHSVNIDSINTANEEGAYQTVQYLIDCGHREIGFIGETTKTSSYFARYCGFCKAMSDHGLPIRKEHCMLSGSSLESLFSVRSELEQRLDQMPSFPTAWFCANDGSAVTLIHILQARGIRVPEDISVAGFDDQKISEIVVPALTTYHVHRMEMGRTAVKELLERMENPARPPRKLSLLGELIVRDSVGRREEA